MTLAEKIYNCFKKRDCFSLTEAYEENIVKPRETMRARIYDNLVIRFERIANGTTGQRIWRFHDSDVLTRLHTGCAKNNNVLERLNRELKRRSDVIQVFPNKESVLRHFGNWFYIQIRTWPRSPAAKLNYSLNHRTVYTMLMLLFF